MRSFRPRDEGIEFGLLTRQKNTMKGMGVEVEKV